MQKTLEAVWGSGALAQVVQQLDALSEVTDIDVGVNLDRFYITVEVADDAALLALAKQIAPIVQGDVGVITFEVLAENHAGT